MYDTEASRWQAIQSRDQTASSSFVYAVVSTKIYCRPGCPSRLARRANVCFYDTAEEAAAAGYRPCLRCKPNQSAFVLGSQHGQHDAVRRACEYIQETKGQTKFADVAKRVGLSSRYLYGLFKTVMGTTPAKYATRFKSGHGFPNQSETLSAVSGAFTPEDDQVVGTVVDAVSWEALLNLDHPDFATMRESLSFNVQLEDVCNDLWTIEGIPDKNMMVNEGFDVEMPASLNLPASAVDQLELTANLLHPPVLQRFPITENSLPVDT